jgi:hypothetical protein
VIGATLDAVLSAYGNNMSRLVTVLAHFQLSMPLVLTEELHLLGYPQFSWAIIPLETVQ